MNRTTLITSAAGIALLMATALPAAAFAEEGSDDSSSVTSSSVVNVSVNGTGEEHQGFFAMPKLPDFHFIASTTAHVVDQDAIRERIEMRMERHASSTEERHASSTERRIMKAEDKADDSIAKRIDSLNQLMARLEGMKLLPADALATIKASLQGEIDQLTALEGQIGSDASLTATTSLKTDVGNITKANRVYLLVEPKARIAAAADRIKAVATQLTALAAKLEERITAAQGAGVDVSAATAAMGDMNAKLADATAQANAAVSETANLQVDNGDKTVLAANQAALKDARTKLAAAQKDLAAARHDAATIFGVVKGKGGVSATASTTTP